MTPITEPQNLAHRVAEALRQKLVAGHLAPGQRLSEASLSTDLDVSRNTLREAFRILTTEGLLVHAPNKGVSVAVPTIAAIIDIYRVRRMVECQALEHSYPLHPAHGLLRQSVAQASACRDEQDWTGVGTANMVFHKAVVALADSPRLNALFAQVLAELRLVFGLLKSPEFLHAPYVDMNRRILALYEAGDVTGAAAEMRRYLNHAERVILAHLGTVTPG